MTLMAKFDRSSGPVWAAIESFAGCAGDEARRTAVTLRCEDRNFGGNSMIIVDVPPAFFAACLAQAAKRGEFVIDISQEGCAVLKKAYTEQNAPASSPPVPGMP